jgi:hypothetical protein
MRPLTEADERAMLGMQARADSAYQVANRRAPPPLLMERPEEYRRRLADGVKAYSPRWSESSAGSGHNSSAARCWPEPRAGLRVD